MNNKCSIVLALLGGIVGGTLTRYITPPSAFAQNTATQEIRAQSVTLVDFLNRTVGTFTVAPVGRRIVLQDSQGLEIWSAGGSNFRNLTIR